MNELEKLRNETDRVVAELESVANDDGLPVRFRLTILDGTRVLLKLMAQLREAEKREQRRDQQIK